MLSPRLQLADVLVYRGDLTIERAIDLAAATLADLTGCVLVAVELSDQRILLAARPDQQVLAPPGDVIEVAAEAYESLVGGNGILSSRSATSETFGSPLAE